jgi:nucleoside phosphorylase
LSENGETLMPITNAVVVLTAIQAETEAVLRHLENHSTEQVDSTWFHVGRFSAWTVAVAEVGSGNAAAATIAMRAFTHFKPEIAAFVGVAGGLKDVALGDVVVATKVYGYESGKETPGGFQPRPDVQNSHHELQQRARVIRASASWQARLASARRSNRKPAVWVQLPPEKP